MVGLGVGQGFLIPPAGVGPPFPVSSAALSIITSSPLPNATTSSFYSTTIMASGGTAPYIWSITANTPDTGSWSSINSSTGVITGTPGTSETESIIVKVVDSTTPTPNTTSKSFSLFVQNAGVSPSAPQNFQIINQGGPSASQETTYGDGAGYGTATPGTGASFNQYQGTTTGIGISANYQGMSWLPANQGSGGAIAKYNIYRNGSLYDSMTIPITIVGYIAPTTDSLGQSCGLLTVVSVSGGSSTNSISDGKILGGLKLTSAAGGFVSGSKVVAYQSASYGGGGTGNYYVDQSQTVGSSGSHQTFTGWGYNDTASTNCLPLFNGTVGITVPLIYKYTVTATDVSSNEGPAAYPAMFMYQGFSMTGQANFSYGGTTTWTDTTGSPVNGPYDVMIVEAGGGYGFQPVWCNAFGDGNSHSYMTPPCRAEVGAFNYFVFDIKPNDSTYNGGVGPQVSPIMRCFGQYNGIDSLAEQAFNCYPYCTPPLAAGQWSTCKIPFSAMGYGVATITGTFVGVGVYQAQIHVTAISAQQMKYFAGATWVTGPGVPANSNLCGGTNGGQSGYTDPQGPYTSFPYVFNVYGPNITGSENTGSITMQLQASTAYKNGWTPNTSLSTGQGTIFLNNIGFTTI